MTPNFLIQRLLPTRSDPVNLRTSAVFRFLLSEGLALSLDDRAAIRKHISQRGA